MVPASRLYQLVLLGTVLGLAIALYDPQNLVVLQSAIALTLLFDLVVLGLGFWDMRQGRSHRIQIRRDVTQKLSIGRENPVHLHMQTASTGHSVRV